MEKKHSSNSDILIGDKEYKKNARIALPILVRQAKAGQTITYTSLAEELGVSNPRNLNYMLGSIGRALMELAKREGVEIPQIQSLVITKGAGLPGDGIDGFLSQSFKTASQREKRRIISEMLIAIYSCPHWDWVLDELGLEPNKAAFSAEIEKIKQSGMGGGESPEHESLKVYVSEHPKLLGLGDVSKVETEYILPSKDAVDVMFFSKKMAVGVEVKSKISPKEDILRGLFQCVKYKALIEAEQIVNNQQPNARVVLVLEDAFPKELLPVKHQLDIEVIEYARKKR